MVFVIHNRPLDKGNSGKKLPLYVSSLSFDKLLLKKKETANASNYRKVIVIIDDNNNDIYFEV